MRPLTRVRVTLVLILAVGAAVAIWLRFSRQRTAESLASLAEQRMMLESELRQAQFALAAAKQKREPRHEQAAPPTDVRTPPPVPPPIIDRRADALRKDPALQGLYLKAEHSKIRGQYGELFIRLNLSPEQMEAFASNVLRRREQVMDLNAIAQKQDPSDRSAIASLRKQSGDEYLQAQRALLGEIGFKELQTYERMAQPRETVASLAGLLATMDLPLSQQQGAQLAAFMANSVDLQVSKGRIELSYADWSAIDRGAESILTGSQLAVFRTLSPAGGSRPRWVFEFNAALRSAQEREVAEHIRNVPPR
jgi:hypothetical protein